MTHHDWYQTAAYAFGGFMILSMGGMALFFLPMGLVEAFKSINEKTTREPTE